MRVQIAALLVASIGSLGAQDRKPKLEKTPPTEDQIAVYRTLLAGYNNGAKASLNLGNITMPLHISAEDLSECLNGLKFPDLASARSTVHPLSAVILPGKNYKLVDPKQQADLIRKNDPSNTIRQGKPVDDAVADAFASGLLQISEIAFDDTHTHAVVAVSFHCGGLCGNGATYVFEKVNGQWKEAGPACSNWIA